MALAPQYFITFYTNTMNGEQTLNYKSECLKTQSNFQSQTIFDVCKGTNTTIPVGSMDLTITVVVITFVLVIIFCILGLFLKIIFE